MEIKEVLVCPKCKNENELETKICVYCGELLINVEKSATTKFLENNEDDDNNTPKWGSARFNSRTNLVLGIEGEARTLEFDADAIEELVLGREDPKTGTVPAVNLSPYGAQEKGVSRKHSSIIRKDGSLYLVDHASANGTFLNGHKLVANQSRVLRDGDDVRLGKLEIRVTFERVTSASKG